jgi:hypothetical protein
MKNLFQKIRKGQGHIEMIMSFTLFLGFIITMLVFFRPAVKSRGVTLTLVENKITENISTWVYFFSIKASSPDCFCFSNPYVGAKGNVIILNSSAGTVGGWVSGDSICIERSNSGFFYIYMSSEFKETDGDCNNNNIITLDLENDVGLLRGIMAVSNSSLWNLKQEYDQNYTQLRERMGMSYDFRFIVFDRSNEKVMELQRKIPLGKPVYSKDKSVEIVYENGEVEESTIRFYVW